jgi:serine/threonine protein kinase/WD40 repeat protein
MADTPSLLGEKAMHADPGKAKTIFLRAVEITAVYERQVYLAEACAGDKALFREVQELLRHQEQLGSFLEFAPTHQATAAEPAWEGPGTVIGPYKLLEQIGEGGFGIVFMGEQTVPVRRKVALKLLKAGMDSRQVVARFEAERQALAIMDHPSIAKVFDAGATAQGRPYFVMELVKGVTITEYCDANHLPPRQRLELFVQVCHAVQHAHQKGIIHRDLKPSNVLVTVHDITPVVKIIDFGVAKALGQELTDKTLFTGFGQMIGTPHYMSPEQAGQSGLDVDTRSDIYSLGVLLYELLTGSTPFTKDRFQKAAYDEIRRIIREEEPPRPSTRLSDLGRIRLKPGTAADTSADRTTSLASVSGLRQTEPANLTRLVRGELDWIVMKCLEKDRSLRYASASGLAADVQRYLSDEPVQAFPPSTWYRLRKLVRRHKGPVWAASLLVLTLLGGIIGTTWGLIRATDAQAQAVSESKQKETALTTALHSERDGKESLWLSLYEQARARRFSRRPGQRLDSLSALSKAAQLRPDERLRDEAIAALALPDVRAATLWHDLPPNTAIGRVGRSGRLLANATSAGTISIRSMPEDREVREIASGSMAAGYLYFSPDERFLVGLGEENSLRLWRVADGKPALRESPKGCFGHSFSADGSRLAVGRNNSVLIFDLATGLEVNRWPVPYSVFSLAMQPNDEHFAVGFSQADVVSIHNSATGALIANLSVGQITDALVAWHPDGKRLAIAGADLDGRGRIHIWDVAARRRVALLEGHAQQVNQLTIHPEGELMASGSWDGSVRLWHPGTGRELLQLATPGVWEFSEDGRGLGIAIHGRQFQFFEVTPSREYRTLVSSLGAGKAGYSQENAISPDGQLLALSMIDAVRLCHLASGRELAVLPMVGRPLFRSNTELLIVGRGGLHRWPIQSEANAKKLRIGPPRTIPLPFDPARVAHTWDGQKLAILSDIDGTILLVDLPTEAVQTQRFDHAKATILDVSRDGRWLATSGWHSDRVRLWNAESGTMVHEWIGEEGRMVYFTPDSRSLILCLHGEFSVHDIQSQQEVRRIRRDVAQFPGHVGFTPDGAIMALEMAPGIIHLKDTLTDRTIAKLEDPSGDRAAWMSFSPDGTKLMATAPYADSVHIWDLRLIRQHLAESGLDWDAPPYPLAVPIGNPEPPAKVEVILGDPVANCSSTRQERSRQKIEGYRLVLERNPDSPTACNNLAWVYLTAPEPVRDVTAALPLAEKAVRLKAANAIYCNTLGVAYYRAGRYREAIEMLRPNLDKKAGSGLAIDLYFLAMSHHRLGEVARAKDYYEWAVRWRRTHESLPTSRLEELDMFRAEAEKLLEIGRTKD